MKSIAKRLTIRNLEPVHSELTGVKVQHLDDWALSMHGEHRSYTVISERTRVLAQFGHETGIQPSSASSLEIAQWMAEHRHVWSLGTAGTYFGYLKAWYHWLQVTDRRIDNPMVKLKRPPAPDREPQPVSDNGLVRLLTTPMHHRTRVMILEMVCAGKRCSEVAATQGEHYNLDSLSVWIDGKNHKSRSVPMHSLLIEVAQTMPRRGIWYPSNSTRPGEHILGKSVSHIVSLVMQRAEVPGTAHKLRHWFGSTLLDDGADLLTIRDLLRHASLATTQIYTKTPQRLHREAINRLDPWRGRAA